ALVAARDGLCLAVARHWQLPPALLQPAAEVARQGLRPGATLPVRHLYAADRLAAALATRDAPPGGPGAVSDDPEAPEAPEATAATAALLAACGPATAGCWRALAAAQRTPPDPAQPHGRDGVGIA
ncbi:MAG: hypothetical protein KGK09_09290, partial [Burkholderiales bacterium]|nr:hypothetical protein [Burkholderiales bacterium]